MLRTNDEYQRWKHYLRDNPRRLLIKREKRVMRTAFNMGLPTIVIMPNGFTSLSKPHGEQFDACAQGRLLMVSAWEHHNERQPLTAYMCQQMNLIALELSGM